MKRFCGPGARLLVIFLSVIHTEPINAEDSLLREKRQSSSCRTWNGKRGICDGIQRCPHLLLNLAALRNSICLIKSFFPVPGVCCPYPETQESALKFPTTPSFTTTVTSKPLNPKTTKGPIVTRRPTTKKPTTRRPTTRRPTTRRPTTKRIRTTTTTKRPTTKVKIVTKRPKTTKKPTTTTTTTKKPVFLQNQAENSPYDGEIDRICGQSNVVRTRVVGGSETPPGAYPWVAAIFLRDRKGIGTNEFWCGGVVIDKQHVLTAAHCFHSKRGIKYKASQLDVVLGDHHLYRKTEGEDPQHFKVTQIKPHPRFSRYGFYNDIALLKLDKKMRFTEYVQPVCLPKAGTIPQDFLGLRGTVTGWGTLYYGGPESETLQEVDMPIWRNEDCNRVYTQQITDTFVCAGYADGGRDSCQGDSGSPMTILNKNGQWTVIGVVSFGNKCAKAGYPGVYTRISEYLDWIEEKKKS